MTNSPYPGFPQQPSGPDPQLGQQPGYPQQGQQAPDVQQPGYPQQGQQSGHPQPDSMFGAPATPLPGTPMYGRGAPVPEHRPVVRKLGLVMLALVAALLLIRLGIDVAQAVTAPALAASFDGSTADAAETGFAVGSIVSLVLVLLNTVATIALLVLAIIAIVQGRGRPRIGAVIVAAMVPVAIVLSFVLSFIVMFATTAAGVGSPDVAPGGASAAAYRNTALIDMIRVVLCCAAMGVGAWLVFRNGRAAR
jgi:hypothetical protein